MAEPEARFDEVIHPAPRLSIVALLAPATWMEFQAIRDHVGTTDSALSKQISALETAGYVEIAKHKAATGKRRTWIRLNQHGRTALDGHITALHRMVGNVRPA